MLFRCISYLKFLTKATNQHGVHSPFVYDLITKCLYSKASYKGSKVKKCLLKCIAYFNATHISVPQKGYGIWEELKAQRPSLLFKEGNIDVIAVDLTLPYESKDLMLSSKIHNNTFIFLEGLYKTKKSQQKWEALKALTDYTVSIDLYSCGLLFFRKEQGKQHFRIRI